MPMITRVNLPMPIGGSAINPLLVVPLSIRKASTSDTAGMKPRIRWVSSLVLRTDMILLFFILSDMALAIRALTGKLQVSLFRQRANSRRILLLRLKSRSPIPVIILERMSLSFTIRFLISKAKSKNRVLP